MHAEPPLAGCEPSDCSQSLPQTISEKDAHCSQVKKEYDTRKEVHLICSDEHKSVVLETNVNQEVQRLGHGEVQTFAESLAHPPSPIPVFEKTTEEKIFEISAANKLTELSGPLAAQLDDNVTIQELEKATTPSQPSSPSGFNINLKQIEIGDTHVKEECVLATLEVEQQALPHSQNISEQNVRLKSPVANHDGDSNASKKKEGQTNVETLENKACEAAQEPVEKSNLKDACDITMETADLESQVETRSCQEQLHNDQIEDAGDAKMTTSETELKLFVHQSHERNALPDNSSIKADEMPLEGTTEVSLPSNRPYRSSFDWAGAKRKKSDVSTLPFAQGSPMSEQNPSDSSGLLRHSTIPSFLKSKHKKVPLVISRATDLLNASSISGTAASTQRHQQGERKDLKETCKEMANMKSRASLSTTSFPVPTSTAVSRLSWQTTPGCSRAHPSTAGPSTETDGDMSCSQEREDQQASFRTQISKIEQFLNTERLRLPKRRKTDN
ncbi:hypothetical protein PBY51_012378 [Eleginops maclovinus]|uniref:Uncharacterized protein n=1 Tax=Eleginops maclovinus TaxID=56733 RepID=A0AAN8AUP9_ELEMC|nr:hypothetical protein PBY51_012378 [Eleginops maclovinus]